MPVFLLSYVCINDGSNRFSVVKLFGWLDVVLFGNMFKYFKMWLSQTKAPNHHSLGLLSQAISRPDNLLTLNELCAEVARYNRLARSLP